jgi:hypothetical protein
MYESRRTACTSCTRLLVSYDMGPGIGLLASKEPSKSAWVRPENMENQLSSTENALCIRYAIMMSSRCFISIIISVKGAPRHRCRRFAFRAAIPEVQARKLAYSQDVHYNLSGSCGPFFNVTSIIRTVVLNDFGARALVAFMRFPCR